MPSEAQLYCVCFALSDMLPEIVFVREQNCMSAAKHVIVEKLKQLSTADGLGEEYASTLALISGFSTLDHIADWVYHQQDGILVVEPVPC